MNRDIITVYLLLKSKRELNWEDLLKESGLDCEALMRSVMLLQLKQYVKRVGDRFIFLGKRNHFLEEAEDEVLKCTDYYDARFSGGDEGGFKYRRLSDLLELRLKRSFPLKLSLDGESLPMTLVIDLDGGDGKIELVYGKNVLNIPYYIDSDSLMLDLYELFQFYKKYAERGGSTFIISRAYCLFHRIANCSPEYDDCKLSSCNNVSQLEFDAAITCIQICRAVTEILNIENVTVTIDTITRACQITGRGIERLKKLAFLENQEISNAYRFPLSPFEIGTLVMGKGGVPLCLLNGDDLFAKIPVHTSDSNIEIDFSHVVEKYVENAKNNGNKGLNVDKVTELFFSMFNEEKSSLELEELLGQLETREEMDLLNTMYLISYLTMENQTKEVSVKIKYEPPKTAQLISYETKKIIEN